MTQSRQIYIIKADGNRVPFDVSKLRHSLLRAGTKREVVDDITKQIERELRDGMLTSDIYKRAYAILRKVKRPFAARYSMKRAMLQFGPSGFPFEKFVAEIFRYRGYTAVTGINIHGSCAQHEVDLIASNKSRHIGAELKFHNRLGTKSDLKDALYVRARFLDIQQEQEIGEAKHRIDEGWFITNTKFTKNAIKYGNCAGLIMVSWDYPKKGNLQDLIEESRVQPVTCLTSFSQADKVELLKNDIVLCRSIREKVEMLHTLGFNDSKIESAIAESGALCGSSNDV